MHRQDIVTAKEAQCHNRKSKKPVGNVRRPPDEDGDLVCEECGAVLPAEEEAPAADEDYECPDCGHITVNPEPDDEGDRICEECGCILPEKLRCECKKCGFENIDPVPNEDGEYFCAKCGEQISIEVSLPMLGMFWLQFPGGLTTIIAGG